MGLLGRFTLDWLEGPAFVEDVERIPATHWLVASGMSPTWGRPPEQASPAAAVPGRLYLVDTELGHVVEGWPDNGAVRPSGAFESTAPPDPGQFAPQGIAIGSDGEEPGATASWLLYTVHHGIRESIEVFRIEMTDDRRPEIAWIGTIPRRPGIEGNAVAPHPGGGVIASHYPPGLPFRPDLHDGRANGGVERWTPDGGWTTVAGLDSCFPNGVAVSGDGSVVFVADSTGMLRRSNSAGTDTVSVSLPFSPDNLKWGEDGRLLTTGVRSTGLDAIMAAVSANPPDPLDIVVVAVDPTTLDVEVLVDEHAAIGLVTTAISVDGDLYLTDLAGTRLTRLRTRS